MFFLRQIDKPITSLVLALQASGGKSAGLLTRHMGASIFHRMQILIG